VRFPLHPDLRFHNYATYLRRRLGEAAVRISVILHPGLPVEEQVLRTIHSPGRHRASRRLLVYFQKYSNSYAAPEELDRVYRAAFCHPDVVGIVVGTRPDCLGSAVLDVLEGIARERYVSVEIGLQSLSDEVLDRVGRGHTVETFRTAAREIRRRGIDAGVHLIYGLPGDTRENFLEAADLLSELDVQGVKLHHFHVVAGSGFEKVWRNGGVPVPTYDEYLRACVDFLERLSPEVAVLRLMGSAPAELLLAPRWKKGSREMAQDVAAEFRRRGTWQGVVRDRGPAGGGK